MPASLEPKWFLGPEGPVADSLADYETRDPQIKMASAIARALGDSAHLIVEAGTGVGKSFAYLIAAVGHALENREKVVISTYTISLQEQLIQKDIPFLQEICGREYTAVLAKGRSNYLCERRLEQARQKQLMLFDQAEHLNVLEDLYFWSLETKVGSLSELPFAPPPPVWEQVCSDQSSCQGSVCNRNSDCFYQKARRKLYKADLIVVNHALLFSDLAVRLAGGSILPDYKCVIFDEAHNLESVAGRHFGLRLSNAQVGFLMNRLYNPRNEKGVLADKRDDSSSEFLGRVRESSEQFFDQLLAYYDQAFASGGNGRVKKAGAFENKLSHPLRELGMHLAALSEEQQEQPEKLELTAYATRCYGFADTVEAFVRQAEAGQVYWVEAKRRRHQSMVTLCASPIHIGSSLKKTLYDTCKSVILTSATLSTAGHESEAASKEDNGFGFFSSRLGLEKFRGVQLGSPFDYDSQVKVYVESHLPDPSQQSGPFLEQATRAIEKYLAQTEGKALILFTSFSQLNKMAENLRSFCETHDYLMLEHGAGKNRSDLLDEFRENKNSILLGTESFWQGIDVPGESLSNVMIVKLPFAVPAEPLLQARLDDIRAKGGNPFMDYQLPESILKFKQGFGRLVRRQSDKGIVVILDPRITRKPYGRLFLKALPDCPVEIITEP